MRLPLDIVLKEVISYYGISKKELFRDCRVRGVVQRRQVFFYLASKHTRATLQGIGMLAKENGRKDPYDHATVRHGKINIENLLFCDKELKSEVSEIVQILRKSKYAEFTDMEMVFKSEIEDLGKRIELIEQKIAS